MNNDEHESALADFEKRMAEVQRLRNEADRVRRELINDIVGKIRTLEKQLHSLGYHEHESAIRKGRGRRSADAEDESSGADSEALTLPAGTKRRKSRRGGFGAKTFSEAYCSICELQGHDLRAHRGQKQKRKFTEAQLQEKGLLPS